MHLLSSCVYCGSNLSPQDSYISEHPHRKITESITHIGRRCEHCNWWYIQQHRAIDDDLSDYVAIDLVTYEGIVSKFDLEQDNISYQHFSQELMENSNGFRSRSPQEIEKITASIFSQYYNCEVRHVGRSGDNGIDVIVIVGDTKTAVQVKHRRNEDRVESVTPVREFAGAMLHQQIPCGVFVTTAGSFSNPAQRFAEELAAQRYFLRLIDVHGLRELLQAARDSREGGYNALWGKVTKEADFLGAEP
jgi:restriction endonuclease Mrr